jgi:acyl-CoA synthetase (AMP-forming)/AMP-acid ligase II
MTSKVGATAETPSDALQDLAREALARTGEGRAVKFEGRWYSRTEFSAAGEAVARLVEAAGAEPRAPVLFIARNLPATLAAALALLRAGRSLHMLYSFQSPAAVARQVREVKPALVVAAEQDLGDEVQAALREVGAAVVALSTMAAFALPGFERSSAGPAADPPPTPTLSIQTSGTTGPPKHYPVTYEKAFLNFIEGNPLVIQARSEPELPPALAYAPLANVSGMLSTLPAVLIGRPVILLERWNVAAFCDYMREVRPAAMGFQPAFVRMILDAQVPAEDMASLRSISVGSAPLAPSVQREFTARYGIPVMLAYGATEFLGTVAAWTAELHARYAEAKYGSVGRAVPGVTLRIADPDTGAVLPPGRQGVVEVLAPKVQPDWIHTSDLAVIDEDGFVFMRGRADGAIIRGGYKILPETIERALHAHPAVAVGAVTGVADHRLGQVPAAAIQLKPGAERPTIDELKAHLREHVLATHIPVHWRFVEDVPRTQSMKVDRGALARLFEAAETA